jgi:hypothetical protein
MLHFLIRTGDMNVGDRHKLEETIREPQTDVRPGLESTSFPIWKKRLKDLVKSRMAIRYRKLPRYLAMAEQGVSMSLGKPRT